MALKDLKKGDKLYAVYNYIGRLYCDNIFECTVKKVITKDFVTRIYIDDDGRSIGKRVVGYYLGECALNENYFFTTSDSRLKTVNKIEQGWLKYLEIKGARDRLIQLIKDGE